MFRASAWITLLYRPKPMFGVVGFPIARPPIDARSILLSSENFVTSASSQPNRAGRGNSLTGCRQKPLAAPASIVHNDPARSLIDCPHRRRKTGRDWPVSAVKLVDDLAGESPASASFPVGTVVISGDGAGDQTVESPEVNVLDGWMRIRSAPTGGQAKQQVVAQANRS